MLPNYDIYETIKRPWLVLIDFSRVCKLAKKVNISLVMSLRPYVRMEYLCSRWEEFRKILFWEFSDQKTPSFFKKPVKNNSTSQKMRCPFISTLVIVITENG
jgi:hypothetical protein